MKVLIDVGHPAHAHFFRHIIAELEKRGSEVAVAAREREMLFYLLDRFGLEYTVIGRTKEGLLGKAADMLKKDLALARLAEQFGPDLMMAAGAGSPYTAQVARLKSIPSIICTDTEHAKFINWLTLPFSDTVCTPSCYEKTLHVRYHIRYESYHELAYLHPKRYSPRTDVRKMLDIPASERLILIKLARWSASHDLGVSGFAFKSDAELEELVRRFEEHGRVLISSELPLPASVRGNEVRLPQEHMHDLIAASSLYFGEGATMASEAAVLGVPSIFISTLRLGYLNELQEKYGLAYSFDSRADAVPKAEQLLTGPGVKSAWEKKRSKMLNEKIDVTGFITELILNYPDSVEMYRTGED